MMPLLRHRHILPVVFSLLGGVAILAQTPAPTNAPAATPPAPKETAPAAGVVGPVDVIYGKGGTVDLHAEYAYPEKVTGLLPAVILIHGGGWIHGSYKPSGCVGMAKRGYFGVSIEYRLSDAAKWPAQLDDCKLAVRWLRANAEKFHVDPNRIGVEGWSAGGHLVDCLGTMADVKVDESGGYPGVSTAVQAVVTYYGPTDFTRDGIYNSGTVKLVEGLMGVPKAQNPELWKSGSPLLFVKAGDPPFLIIQGDSDTTVPPSQSTDLAAALDKVGVPNQLIIVKNAGHSLKPVPNATVANQPDPPREQVDAAAQAFLAKYLKP
jgi:acetyl esterase/lipase